MSFYSSPFSYQFTLGNTTNTHLTIPEPNPITLLTDNCPTITMIQTKQTQLEAENRELKRRLEKLETWFNHIRERSSMLDEFIKMGEQCIESASASSHTEATVCKTL